MSYDILLSSFTAFRCDIGFQQYDWKVGVLYNPTSYQDVLFSNTTISYTPVNLCLLPTQSSSRRKIDLKHCLVSNVARRCLTGMCSVRQLRVDGVVVLDMF